MAAVIELRTGDRILDSPRRPQLRLVQGDVQTAGGHPAVSRRTYMLRRSAVLVAAVVVVVLTAQLLAGIGRVVASELDVAPEASGRTHVVEAGETAWEIAGRLAPEMDRRQAVDQLLALNGHSMVRSGQVLRLPASFR